jgi:hypothetical protein
MIHFKVTFQVSVELLGSYPAETGAWTNSTLVMGSTAVYGSKTNVMRGITLDINMTLSKFNNSTKAQVISSNLYRHTMNAVYPSDVYSDADLFFMPGFPAELVLVVAALPVVYLAYKIMKKKRAS